MWKKMISLTIVLVLVLALAAQAAEARGATARVDLTFKDEVATCSANVTADRGTDTISGRLVVLCAGTPIRNWPLQGTGSLRVKQTMPVESGKTYTLTLIYTINGVQQQNMVKSATCP